jgi:hypothetical protein
MSLSTSLPRRARKVSLLSALRFFTCSVPVYAEDIEFARPCSLFSEPCAVYEDVEQPAPPKQGQCGPSCLPMISVEETHGCLLSALSNYAHSRTADGAEAYEVIVPEKSQLKDFHYMIHKPAASSMPARSSAAAAQEQRSGSGGSGSSGLAPKRTPYENQLVVEQQERSASGSKRRQAYENQDIVDGQRTGSGSAAQSMVRACAYLVLVLKCPGWEKRESALRSLTLSQYMPPSAFKR